MTGLVGVIACQPTKKGDLIMKWIEFAISLIIDALLLAYFVASFTAYAMPVSMFAKCIYGVICCIAAVGTVLTYKEARHG